jgi:hypothetical protein
MKINKLGRKPIDPKFKRKQVTIGVRYIDIHRHGGEDALKIKLLDFVECRLNGRETRK